jgi:hypothetical protein
MSISGKTETPSVFLDRFDKHYLEYLLTRLDSKNLTRTALLKDKTIGSGKNKKTYNKCISIDFCGIAAGTVLGIGLEWDELGDNIHLRKKIRDAFRLVVDRDTLIRLNKRGYYLKVRFCFSYLYSDYPICLIKAEDKDPWKIFGDNAGSSFKPSYPVTQSQFENSNIYHSQKEALRKIFEIIDKNEDLIILGGSEKKANTIQVRFNCIPSPICVLIINDKVAFCDPYMYAKFEDVPHLSLNCPVNVITEKNKVALESIRKHFNYLWRHDLTLFCGDATSFEPDNMEGLSVLTTPEQVLTDKKFNWAHKEKRIIEKKRDIAKKQHKKFVVDRKEIKKWRDNLDRKFELCTKKLEDISHTTPVLIKREKIKKDSEQQGSKNVRIKLAMDGSNFMFEIIFKDLGVICKKSITKENFLFSVLAHYHYARIAKKKPVLYQNSPNKNAFMSQLVTILDKSIIKGKAKGRDLAEILFSKPPKFNLNVPVKNILLDNKDLEAMEAASYSIDEKDQNNKYIRWSCLHYTLLTKSNK